MMGGGMNGFGFGGFGSYGLIGMLLNLVITLGVIIGVVWLIVWVVKRVAPTGGAASWQGTGGSPTAREIVQTRYARGEITRDEYLEILEDLK